MLTVRVRSFSPPRPVKILRTGRKGTTKSPGYPNPDPNPNPNPDPDPNLTLTLTMTLSLPLTLMPTHAQVATADLLDANWDKQFVDPTLTVT